MPRLVRRRPLAERIGSYLNLWDFLLWVSEEIEGNDWDQLEKDWGMAIGIAVNAIFLIARANSQSSGSRAIDDVFGEESGVAWGSWLASITTSCLVLTSFANALYTFYKTRSYRLFESAIDKAPATPSAQRVRVDSSPMIASPIRYLANALSTEPAESRAHPDAHRDVWQLSVWDPLPICLRLFCLFSPGHVMIYWLLLPTQLSDPRPSVTVVTTILFASVLSAQLSFLSSFHKQQAKDLTVVHKEVLKEYDTKFVHPRTQPLMRDVGTQFSDTSSGSSDNKFNKVDVYTPAFNIQGGFKTSPNPNYLSHVDPEGLSPRRLATTSSTPSSTLFQAQPSLNTPQLSRDASPLVRTSGNAMRQPQFRPSASTSTGDGGSLGVYSHANSPLRKSASTAFDRRLQSNGDFFYKERGTSPLKKPLSPLKRTSVPGPASPAVGGHRPGGSLGTRRETGRF
ncbi:uncharacterized protein PFLUO_LOCUS3939 [Penicillium psychrofluorescens]|uniref:uncharacterized protein n=1 Tax=Penicillium psychrofluorescens TaxID=3158075 RepID=UPI003CCDBF55